MMISCEECGKTYQIHSKELKKNRGVATCETCHHQMIVQQSEQPSSSDDDPFDILEDLPLPPGQPVSSDDPFDILEDQPVSRDTNKPISGDVNPRAPSEAVLPEPIAPEPPPQSPKRRLSLPLRLAFWVLLVTLIPLMLFGVTTYKLTGNQGETYITTRGNRTAAHLAFQVDEWMDKNIRMLKAFSQLPDIISNNRTKQASILDAVKKGYPWIHQIVTVDTNGTLGGDKDAHGIDYTKRACIQAVMTGKSVAWETVWDDTSGKPVLVLAVPIQTSQGSIAGVLAGLMNFDGLASQITGGEQGDTGFAFLVDEAGNRVVYPRPDDPESQKRNLADHPLINAINAGQTGLIFFTDTHGLPSVGQAKRTAFGWVLATQQQEEEAFNDLKQAKLTLLLLLGGTFMLVFFIALAWSQSIARPINDLVIAADRISIGELGVEIKTKRKDEIGDMAEAISRMQDSIRLSIERLRRHRK